MNISVNQWIKEHLLGSVLLAYLLIMLGWFGWQFWHGATLAGLFFTNEQRAQLALNEDDYTAAAGFFPDPYRSAQAHYFGREFAEGAEIANEIDSVEALLLVGNASAHQRDYFSASAAYRQILERDPGNAAATRNLEIVTAILEQMAAMGESQQQGEGDPKRSEEVKVSPDMADQMKGHDDFGERPPPEEITADQLLNDPAMAELWMQQVQSDPANFLANKFALQRRRQVQPAPTTTPEPEVSE